MRMSKNASAWGRLCCFNTRSSPCRCRRTSLRSKVETSNSSYILTATGTQGSMPRHATSSATSSKLDNPHPDGSRRRTNKQRITRENIFSTRATGTKEEWAKPSPFGELSDLCSCRRDATHDYEQCWPDEPGTDLNAQTIDRPLGHTHLRDSEPESVTEMSFGLKQTHHSLLCGAFLLVIQYTV